MPLSDRPMLVPSQLVARPSTPFPRRLVPALPPRDALPAALAVSRASGDVDSCARRAADRMPAATIAYPRLRATAVLALSASPPDGLLLFPSPTVSLHATHGSSLRPFTARPPRAAVSVLRPHGVPS
ncbi:hypothetical protein B0H14DRAFT_3520576 [Mycena olivaceomarginata]|nr:hypothetical protein B0H14DRAFT_3520576 [Mycena olivaceomarginata]